MVMMMTTIIMIIMSEKRRETKLRELNYSFKTPTNAPSTQPYIATTCFDVTPSSGSSAPRFKTYYSTIAYKVIRIILQILAAGVSHVGFTNCDSICLKAQYYI